MGLTLAEGQSFWPAIARMVGILGVWLGLMVATVIVVVKWLDP